MGVAGEIYSFNRMATVGLMENGTLGQSLEGGDGLNFDNVRGKNGTVQNP